MSLEVDQIIMVELDRYVEVPHEVIQHVEVTKEVPVEVIREVERLKEVVREVPIEVIREKVGEYSRKSIEMSLPCVILVFF